MIELAEIPYLIARPYAVPPDIPADRANYDASLTRITHEIGLMEQRVKAYGRNMTYGINAIVIIGKTEEEEAQAKADEHVSIAGAQQVGTSGVGANLIGTPKTIVERMKRYEDMGISLFMLHFCPMKEGLEEFAEQILPKLSLAE